LRGEALRWYKNNKSTLTSWQIFIQELKEAFISPFHQELIFSVNELAHLVTILTLGDFVGTHEN
jgi:hypothetical protein